MFAGAGLPALAAAFAGVRYQGDFHRFSERAAQTARELQRVENELTAFELRAPDASVCVEPFAELRDIVIHLSDILLSDLEDWRFVYRARPTPEPG